MEITVSEIEIMNAGLNENGIIALMESTFAEACYANDIMRCASIFKNDFQLIKSGNDNIGYCVVREVKGRQLLLLDEDIDEDLKSNIIPVELYLTVDFLEIRNDCKRKGYGRAAVNQILMQSKLPVVLYSTGDSQEFWLTVGFNHVGLSNWWMWNK